MTENIKQSLPIMWAASLADEAEELERIALGLDPTIESKRTRKRASSHKEPKRKRKRQQIPPTNPTLQAELALMASMGLPTALCNGNPSGGDYFVLSHCARPPQNILK